MLTTLMFIVVFDQVAGILTDGAPPAILYVWIGDLELFLFLPNQDFNTFTTMQAYLGKSIFPFDCAYIDGGFGFNKFRYSIASIGRLDAVFPFFL